MASYSIGEAKTQLSKLVRLAEGGEQVVLRRGATPVARLIAIPEDQAGAAKRKPGRMKGRLTIAPDFAQWPPDVARSLGLEAEE